MLEQKEEREEKEEEKELPIPYVLGQSMVEETLVRRGGGLGAGSIGGAERLVMRIYGDGWKRGRATFWLPSKHREYIPKFYAFSHSPDDTLESNIPAGVITTTINRSELLPFIPLAIET